MSQPFDRRDAKTTTDVWLTPQWVIHALGDFDLDPCAAPVPRPWPTAREHYDITAGQDGLLLPWHGRVWLNPPFSNANAFIARMMEHKRGILLLKLAAETDRWMDLIWPHASAVLLVSPRIAFLDRGGQRPRDANGNNRQPPGQTALIAFTADDAEALRTSAISGVHLHGWVTKSKKVAA